MHYLKKVLYRDSNKVNDTLKEVFKVFEANDFTYEDVINMLGTISATLLYINTTSKKEFDELAESIELNVCSNISNARKEKGFKY